MKNKMILAASIEVFFISEQWEIGLCGYPMTTVGKAKLRSTATLLQGTGERPHPSAGALSRASLAKKAHGRKGYLLLGKKTMNVYSFSYSRASPL